jgi:RimK family alpha-L-glutamate ligase
MNIAIIGNDATPTYGAKMVKNVLEARGELVTYVPRKSMTFGDTGEILNNGAAIPKPDVVLLRTGSLSSDQVLDGARIIAAQGTPVLPSPDAIEQARSKAALSTMLQQENVPHPKTVVIDRAPRGVDVSSVDQAAIEAAVGELGAGTATVLKPARDMGGRGVLFYENTTPQTLGAGAEALFDLGNYDQLVAQRWIKDSGGRDVRAYFVQRPDGTVEVAPRGLERFGGEGRAKANVSAGGTKSPIELSDEQREVTERVAAASKLEIGSVDFLPSSEGLQVVEVNSGPGLEPDIVEAIGAPMHERIADLIQSAGRS